MKNFVKKGDVLDYVNGSGDDIASGDVVDLGIGIGVAAANIADTETGSLAMEGVFSLPKTNPLVISQGDKCFWNNSTKKITKTAGSNTLAGYCVEAAASTDAFVKVSIEPLGEKDSSGSLGAAVFVAQIATADASDLATAEALANANKAKINALLTALINAGLMASS